MEPEDVQHLTGQIDALESSLNAHRDEVRVLRDAIDELRESVDYLTSALPDKRMWEQYLSKRPSQHATRNRRITSIPIDPTADDFAERLNRFCAADLDEGVAATEQQPNPDGDQQMLFKQNQDRPAFVPAASADTLQGDSDAERIEACGKLPDQVKRYVEGAIEELHDYAARLKHAATLGDRYVDEFWDNHGTKISELLKRIEKFRTLAEQNGIDGEQIIDAIGGIPAAVRIEPVPAGDLLGRIREYLEATETQVGIRELRQAMGYPGFDPHDPMSNPVHQALSDLREANLVDCYEPDFGEARFTLNVPAGESSGRLF